MQRKERLQMRQLATDMVANVAYMNPCSQQASSKATHVHPFSVLAVRVEMQ